METGQKNNQGSEDELAELKASLNKYKLAILPLLPKTLQTNETKFVVGYIEAQLNIFQGNVDMAESIFDSLDLEPEFITFEERNQSLMAAIDIAIRGTSNRKTKYDEPVEPLFTIDIND